VFAHGTAIPVLDAFIVFVGVLLHTPLYQVFETVDHSGGQFVAAVECMPVKRQTGELTVVIDIVDSNVGGPADGVQLVVGFDDKCFILFVD